MWDPYAEFESTTLPNGLTVHAAHWPSRPWQAVGFVIHSGAEQDPIGCEGTAHFVEHLVSKNAGVPQKDFRQFFRDRGGSVNLGVTGYPFTRYSFFAPAAPTVLAQALSLFGSMLLSATLVNEIERERQVIIGEFQRHFPVQFTLDLARRKQRALYTGSWLERFVRPLGDPESVARITTPNLQTYYNTHYTPANLSVVAVGGLRLAELVALLSESPFARSKNGKRTPAPDPVTNVGPLTETRYVFEASRYLNSEVSVGSYESTAKLPGDINPAVLRILPTMLDEVLTEAIRDRRAWSYHVGTSCHNFRHWYEFSIGCSALALNALDQIEAVVDDCIASLAHCPELFTRVQEQALARNRLIDPSGRRVCAAALDDLAYRQRIISLREIEDGLQQVKMDDITDLLPWLQPTQRWTRISRP